MWKANGIFVSDTPETMGGRLCIKNDNGTVIAVAWDDETRRQIVREHNSHDDLVAALDGLLGWERYMGGWDAADWDRARKAFKLATGKKWKS